MTRAVNIPDYAERRRRHSPSRVGHYALLVLVAVTAVTSPLWHEPLWRRCRLLYWQRHCMRYAPVPGPMSPAAGPVECWQRFVAHDRGARGPGHTTLYLGERNTPSGEPRLVAVYTTSAGNGFVTTLGVSVVTPGSLLAEPVWKTAGPVLPFDLECASTQVVYSAGLSDPRDPCRFTVGSRIDGRDAVLEGRLKADGSITFIPQPPTDTMAIMIPAGPIPTEADLAAP